ncbi:MAG: glycosyltransferase family 4 protein [Oculatellaceae cyanobacterium Prado106]|nr:glycosyltransferase family 4 protein [Oculatellaceae cyanobacterium Prado106]
MNSPRIAWLLTSAFYYWHPMLSCLSERFPQTIAFAAKWQGYAPGYENSFAVDVVGKRNVVLLKRSPIGYGTSITLLPLNIIHRLWKSQRNVIFSNSFGIWTILALLFKAIGRWRIIIAYEGSSPGVDYRYSFLRLMLRRVMVRGADACITNSAAGKDYLTQVLQAPGDRVFAHPYEVPSTKAFQHGAASENRDPAQPLTFLYIGSLIPRKGVHLLLEACALLPPDLPYRLVIVGDGEERSQLQTFAKQQELDQRMEWVGRVSYDQLGSYFQQADVFVLPTLEDTWGVVVMEAMVMGKPVLCSRWAGAAELVEAGVNGDVFDPKHPSELAILMSHLIRNPQKAATMGQAAQAQMTRYSPEAAAQFLSEVTRFVLGEQP